MYGDDTDQDPLAFHNRSRYLNSGTVIGPASDLRLVYETAIRKVDEGRGIIGDQFVFAKIFGEQEYTREAHRRRVGGAGAHFREWMVEKFSWPGKSMIDTENLTIVAGRDYEFGMGLDYESSMFQVMTHSGNDIEFLCFNNSDVLGQAQTSDKTGPISLPSDILHSGNPFALPNGEAKEGRLISYH